MKPKQTKSRIWKRLGAWALSLVLVAGLLPLGAVTAQAAGKVIELTSWDGFGTDNYGSLSYTLQNGDTLDLSGMASDPSLVVRITIMPGDEVSTIIGNPAHTFGNLVLRFEEDASATADNPSKTHLKLQNYRTKTSFESMPDNGAVTVEYVGEVHIGTRYSWQTKDDGYSLKVSGKGNYALTFQGNPDSKLVFDGRLYYIDPNGDVSLTFDGGTVESKSIYINGQYNRSFKSASISVKNGCKLFVDSDFIDSNNKVRDSFGIRVSPSADENGTESVISIVGSTVTVEADNIAHGSYENDNGRGGITGGDKIEIKHSTVTALSHSTNKSGSVFGTPAIGNTGEIVIDNSTVTAYAQYVSEGSRAGGKSAGIGGDYDSINILNSTVTAVGYYGAGIGRNAARCDDYEDWDNKPDAITISGSTVNAYSTYGAGIGSGWVAKSYVDNRTSTTNISISGSENHIVTAVSQYGAGIGAGWSTFQALVSDTPMDFTAGIGGWSDEEVENGTLDDGGGASASSLPSASPRNNGIAGLTTDSGTLTITGNPTINAESGVKAVSLSVTAEKPMMEYTLAESESAPETETPINRASTAGGTTDTGAGAPSYSLRSGYRSLAFWPVSEGTYKLTYGAGAVPLLDEQNIYSDSYTLNAVSSGADALQSFTVIRQRDLGGSVTLSASGEENTNDGKVTVGTELTAVLTDLTPSGIQNNNVSYQWYRNGVKIADKTTNSYTTTSTDDGAVIHCVVTGTGLYRGSVGSQAVTVASASADVPAAPTATGEKAITANSITLDSKGDGWQYGIIKSDGTITWQNDTAFTGLTRNTAYSFVQRVAASAESSTPGPTSAAASFTTLSGKPELPVITITSYEYETFTIKESGVSLYSDAGCTEKITGSYITDYIGSPIYAKYDDAETKNENVTQFQLNRQATPTLNSADIIATQNSLSLMSESGVTYGLFRADDTETPIETATGTGDKITFQTTLNSDTEYVIKARREATDDAFRSLQAQATVVVTGHPHTWGNWTSNGNNTHTRTCSICNATDTGNCSGGEATCTNKAVCSTCNTEYGEVNPDNHTGQPSWVQNEDTHKKVYRCCNAEISEAENHSWENGVCTVCQYPCTHTGGEATCTLKAVCTICNSQYGELDPDNHNPASEWTQEDGKHYHICQNGCGTHLNEANCDGGTATCISKANCSVCGHEYGGYGAHVLTVHNAKEPTCTEPGNSQYWECSVCNQLFSDESGTTSISSQEVTILARGHTAGETWQHDNGSTHWKECEDCGVKVDETDHDYDDEQDITCDTCGYARTIGGDEPEPGHTHRWSDTWSSDAAHHWYECTAEGCPETDNSQKGGYAEHTYDQQVVSDTYKASDATCMQAATYYKSCVCGAKGTKTFTSGGLGDHNLTLTPQVDATCTTAGKEAYYTCQTCGKHFADAAGTQEITDLGSYGNIPMTSHEPSSWQYNDDRHWIECRSCKIELERGDHVYTNDTDTICYICGYERTIGGDEPDPGHTHTYGAYQSDATGHWQECTDPACPATDKGKTATEAHVYTNDADTICDTCGYVRQVASTVFTITFDGNGGSSPDSQTTVDGKLTSLPTPTRSGYNFLGWYTEASGGTAVTTSTVFTADDTLYAHWSRRSSGGGSTGGGSGSSGSATYVPSVDAGRNGDVTVSPSRPSSGQTVTITVDPDAGYALDDLTVTDARGNLVKVTDNGDGTYSFRQPSGRVTIEVTFRETGAAADCPRDDTCPLAKFTDLDRNAWYHDGIHYCVENGLMAGTNATTFAPDVTTSRAMIAVILWRQAGSPIVEEYTDFSDVADGAWHTEGIRWASNAGVVMGYPDGIFRPNDPITREQMAAMLYRYAVYQGMESVTLEENLAGFTDADKISGYAIQAMNWAVGQGIMGGYGDNTLRPQGNATRAQAAAMLQRFCEKFGE